MQEVIINEEWRSISGYLNYQVSNMGRVRNVHGRIMKLTEVKGGYLVLNLCLNGKKKLHTVHRLVAKEFIPNPMNKPTVDHIDNDATNNTIKNLRWAIKKEQEANKLKRLNTTSKYKGVYWKKAISRWVASTKIDGKYIYLGSFKHEEDAALAYNKRATETFGEFVKPNVIS